MPNFATPAWADAVAQALRADSEVARDAATWVHGPIALVADADDSRSFPGAVVRVHPHEGSVTDVSVHELVAAPLTPFELRGSSERWRAALSGELPIVEAALQSKLQLRGDLPVVMRHRSLFDGLARAAATVDTTWPEQPVEA